MNKVFAGCASLAIISMIASPTLGFGISVPEGFTIKSSFATEASPSKEDVLSLPTLGESQKQKIKAAYASYEANLAVLENSRPARPHPIKDGAMKQRQDLERNTRAKIRDLLTAKELDLLINPFGSEVLRKKEAGLFPVPSKLLLVRLPDLEAQKKAQLEALLVDYQNQSKQLGAEIQKQFEQDNQLRRAWMPKEVEFDRRVHELSGNTWKEVEAILKPEQIKVLRSDEDDFFVPTKRQVLELKTLTDAQKQKLQAISDGYAPQVSKLKDSWDSLFQSEWNEIKSKLTAQQLQGMPQVGTKPPFIYWGENRDQASAKAEEGKYELKVLPKTENPAASPHEKPYLVPNIDDKQGEQIKAIIGEYRVRFAALQRQAHNFSKIEWTKIKPILTSEQLTALTPPSRGHYRKQVTVHAQQRANQ